MHEFLYHFFNDNIRLNKPLDFIYRYILMEIFKFIFLNFSAPQKVWKLNISSIPWKPKMYILVDTTML